MLSRPFDLVKTTAGGCLRKYGGVEGPAMKPRLNEKEVAECLGVAPATLRKWRTTGEGPRFLKIGRRVVYDVEVIQAFVARCERGSTSDPENQA